MFGNISTIGYLEGLEYNKIVGLQKESYTVKKILEQWFKDKDQIINGYKNGPARTQHGVNAEYFHTAIKNGEEIRLSAMEGREPNLIMKSPLVNGPDDLIQGDKVLQMKFYRDTNGSLNGCIEHMEKYADVYTHNDKALYIIPPEQYQQLIDIKQGLIPEGMSANQAQSLRQKIERFEAIKGDAIEKAMEPGALTYEEAQLRNIEAKAQDVETQTETTHKDELEKIEESTNPSVMGALKGACWAAGIGAGITTALYIYNDFQNGKNIFKGDYTSKDYQNLLKAAGLVGGKAGAGSLMYYGLNALFKKQAFAVSLTVNLAKGIASLQQAYKKKEIKLAEFINLSLAVGMTSVVDSLGEVGIAAIMAAVLGGLSALGVTLPSVISVIASMIVSLILGFVFTKLVSVCKLVMKADIIIMKAQHAKILKNISHAFECNLTRLRNEFEVFAANVDTMDNRENDYLARVEACNRLSHVYGTNQIDPNESIDSLKARFLK